MPRMDATTTGRPEPRPLMSWSGVDWTQPQPWAVVPCRACGERELAMHLLGATTDFVCMACGDVQKVEADRVRPRGF